LDQYRDALISVYKTKFDLDTDQIQKMLDEETWIEGQHADAVGLKCTVIPNSEPIRAAACSRMPNYLHQPKNISDYIHIAEKKKPEGETVEAKPVDEKPDTQDTPQEETVSIGEVEKRVSGMQSAMAKQMDVLKKDYEAKINDLQVQLKVKDEELTKVNAKVISLVDELKSANNELQKTVSALEDKQNALETLNANVNINACEQQVEWRKLKGKDFFDWVNTQDISKIK